MGRNIEYSRHYDWEEEEGCSDDEDYPPEPPPKQQRRGRLRALARLRLARIRLRAALHYRLHAASDGYGSAWGERFCMRCGRAWPGPFSAYSPLFGARWFSAHKKS